MRIESITITNKIDPPEVYEESWILGENDSNKVQGFIVLNDSNMYDLYIQADGHLYANPDSTYLFGGLSSLKRINGLNILNTSRVTNMFSMFNGCRSLESLDLSNFDTTNVTEFGSMFSDCSSLKSLDLGNFVTDKATNMSGMFQRCSNLETLNVSSFKTTNVEYMNYLFYNCSKVTSLDLSGFDTRKCTMMAYIFGGCSSLTELDLSKFDISGVMSMTEIFRGCSSLTSINLSSFNTSSINSMSYMFYGCSSLVSLDLSNFSTGAVSDMSYMFYNCSNLTELDLSSFNTSNVTEMGCMFQNCTKLTTIYVGLLWNTNKVSDSADMFNGDLVLVGAVAYDSTKVDASMANYSTGYFRILFSTYLKSLSDGNTVINDDGTVDHNMRYMDSSPNNYVTFNGEEWRVIGVFNNVSNGSGESETRVKIIKAESTDDKQWHTTKVNSWKNASLNTELQASSYASNSMVDNAVWYLGDPGGDYAYTATQAYSFERTSTVASGNDSTWTGKVGLMYPSDYAFASSACKDG